MSFYDRWILPRLTDLAMRNKEATRYRSHVVPKASGAVLEIGIGSGLNLPFYTAAVTQLYGLDPSEELLEMARRKASGMPFRVDFLSQSGEELPLDDESVDTVLTTWVLCSIPDPARALKEMKRVLKPGGTLLFVEHGLAPDTRVQRWQQRLNPLWKKFTGGCNLHRKMDDLIGGSGLHFVELETGYAKGPRPLSFIYCGKAQRRIPAGKTVLQ
jgi:ubiquinone/menaquinone biosynthesis C-methylase UbiE